MNRPLPRLYLNHNRSSGAEIERMLPSKFNVRASRVRAYMYSRKFEIRDGLISVANVSSLQLKHLDDVIDGRDVACAPHTGEQTPSGGSGVETEGGG